MQQSFKQPSNSKVSLKPEEQKTLKLKIKDKIHQEKGSKMLKIKK